MSSGNHPLTLTVLAKNIAQRWSIGWWKLRPPSSVRQGLTSSPLPSLIPILESSKAEK